MLLPAVWAGVRHSARSRAGLFIRVSHGALAMMKRSVLRRPAVAMVGLALLTAQAV